MIFIRPNTQVYEILTLLSVVGEYPNCSIHLLGRERVYKALISKLTEKQTFCHAETGQVLSTKLLTISGRGANKTVRLFKKAIPILSWIGADEYYLKAFSCHKFRGDATHINRNHRVAEAIAMFKKAGLEIRPNFLPKLQNERSQAVISEPTYYPSRFLKGTILMDINKTMYTRIVGALFVGEACFAVYNTRNAVMKWCGRGEFKAKQALIDLGRMNAGIQDIDSAILFGADAETVLNTLIAEDEKYKKEYRFDSIYHHIYYLPLNQDGVRQLRFFLIPGWKDKLLDMLFENSQRSYNMGMFEYDAVVDGIYVLAHFDGDIARLIRYRDGIEHFKVQHEVLCFPHQAEYLRKYLGNRVRLKTINIEAIENEFGIGKETDEN